MDMREFTSISGKKFEVNYEVIESKYCSVRELGYLVVPDGRLIVVPKGTHHGTVFGDYISKYLDMELDTFKEMYYIVADNGLLYVPILNELGLIAYFGIGNGTVVPIYQNKVCEKSSFYEMNGILHIPSNYEKLTNEQLITSFELLKTNCSISGAEIMPILVADTEKQVYHSIENIKDKIDENTRSKTL